MGLAFLLVLLVGLVEWLVLFVGQGLVLLLSEERPLRTRVLRSLGYWAVVAGLLALATTVPALRHGVLLPMLLIAAMPVQAGEALLEALDA